MRLFPAPVARVFLPSVAAVMLCAASGCGTGSSPLGGARRIADERKTLNQTVWQDEEAAQEHEKTLVSLWDSLRAVKHDATPLRSVPLERVSLGVWDAAEELPPGIKVAKPAQNAQLKTLSADDWRKQISAWEADGWRLVESEWHQEKFEKTSSGALSTVNILFHLENAKEEAWLVVKGPLLISWQMEKDKAGLHQPITVDASRVTLLQRSGPPIFRKSFEYALEQIEVQETFHDLLAHDLNGDMLSDLVFPRTNRVFINSGDGGFSASTLAKYGIRHVSDGLLLDWTGDGKVDLLTIGEGYAEEKQNDQKKSMWSMWLYEGTGSIPFEQPPRRLEIIGDTDFKAPDTMAAGDIDGDGDVDLFVTQYRPPYLNGHMPTPYYDARDGWPAHLFINEGVDKLREATAAAGIVEKRNRRTYRSSFVDLDEDRDLDLVVVSDFAGVDLYLNDGHGVFTDVTAKELDDPTAFGMSHILADFDRNGSIDLFVTGMGSTTARRLEGMKAGREDFPEHQKMRLRMGYGNRMYVREKDRFVRPAWKDDVARSGWSWGAASLDANNDGFVDIYVANGHRSGKSCADYCTEFWRHDIYVNNSKEDAELFQFFKENAGVVGRDISWNGYEHNNLYFNRDGNGFTNIGFLANVALEADSRTVIADDVNNDGAVDLIVGWADRTSTVPVMKMSVHLNRWPKMGRWIGVRADDVPAADWLGAKIELQTEKGTMAGVLVVGDSFGAQQAPFKHFGLGEAAEVKTLVVYWPGGRKSVIDRPAVGQYHKLKPPSKSSAPHPVAQN